MKKENKKGIYLIFNSKKEIVYIGKSHRNFYDRGFESFQHKQGYKKENDVRYISFLKSPLTSSDINVYEMYLIAKYKPLYNLEGKTSDECSFTLPDVMFSRLFRAEMSYNKETGLSSYTDFDLCKVDGIDCLPKYFN